MIALGVAQTHGQSTTPTLANEQQIEELRASAMAHYNQGDTDGMIAASLAMWELARDLTGSDPAWRLEILRFNIARHAQAERQATALYDEVYALAQGEMGFDHEMIIDVVIKRVVTLAFQSKGQAAATTWLDFLGRAYQVGPNDASRAATAMVDTLKSKARRELGRSNRTNAATSAALAWDIARYVEEMPATARYQAVAFYISIKVAVGAPVRDLLREAYAFARAKLGAEHDLTFRAARDLALDLTLEDEHEESLLIAEVNYDIDRRLAAPSAQQDGLFRQIVQINLKALGREEELYALQRDGRAAEERRLRAELAALPEGENDSFLKSQLSYYVEPAEAITLLRDAIAASERHSGPIHAIMRDRKNLANALIKSGQLTAARDQIDLVLAHFTADPSRQQDALYIDTLAAEARLNVLRGDTDRPLARLEAAYREANKSRNTGPETAALAAELVLPKLYIEFGYDDALMDHLRARRITHPAIAMSFHDTMVVSGAFEAAYDMASAQKAIQPRNSRDAILREYFMQSQALSSATDRAVVRSAARKAAQNAPVHLARFDAWEDAELSLTQARRGLSDLNAARGQSAPADIEARRLELVAQRDAAQARAQEAFAGLQDVAPDIANTLSPPKVTIDALQSELLDADEALIRFAVTPSDNGAILIWVVTRDGIDWAKAPLNNGQLKSAMLGLRRTLMSGNRGAFSLEPDERTVPAFDRGLSHRLYDALFGDPAISQLLADKPVWTIVPHGTLFNLPFNALVTKSPAGRDDLPSDLRQTAWLGLERTVSVLPSISALQDRNSEGVTSRRQPFFGLGDPDFQGAPERVAHSVSRATRARTETGALPIDLIRTLPRLPGTRDEVLEFSTLLGANAQHRLLGADASEARLRAAATRGLLSADVLLIATHGLLAGTFEGVTDPALVLSPPATGAMSTAEFANDGLLTATEVAQLRLDAGWVILSACDTAAGLREGGEGFSGLASAFLRAGAESLLVSHWPVDDAVTVDLTTFAVRALKDGEAASRGQAMQQAMRHVALDSPDPRHAHPVYWAPFQLVGTD